MSSSPGRNDPCPCGSGKKYKKCCLGKAEGSSAPTPRDPCDVEPRLCSAAHQYYSQAAMDEAMKPGGTVKIHPYVLLKLLEGPQVLEAVPATLRANFEKLWKPSRLASMSDDEITNQLSDLGVRFDRERFGELVRCHSVAWDIAESWNANLTRLDPSERDFVGLAACELWRRFRPENPSIEMLDDWMCEGYEYVSRKEPLKALESWWKFWEKLRSRIPPQMRDQQAAECLYPRMSQCLSNWSSDFTMEAHNASLRDPECGEIGIRFLRELLETFPDDDRVTSWKGDLAMISFNLDRDAEAEEICQELIQENPDQAVGYVTLSDGLGRKFYRDASRVDCARRSIAVLEQALAFPVKDASDYDLKQRLADTRKQLADNEPTQS